MTSLTQLRDMPDRELIELARRQTFAGRTAYLIEELTNRFEERVSAADDYHVYVCNICKCSEETT
jgi:hypothetical protein